MFKYTPEHEESMIILYNMLSEKDRRRYAAIEAKKLGHGGISYIATLFGCSRSTIYAGILDLENNDSTTTDRVRKPGGGRKNIYDTIPNIEDEILEILKEYSGKSYIGM